jgi:hypothetical protein
MAAPNDFDVVKRRNRTEEVDLSDFNQMVSITKQVMYEWVIKSRQDVVDPDGVRIKKCIKAQSLLAKCADLQMVSPRTTIDRD